MKKFILFVFLCIILNTLYLIRYTRPAYAGDTPIPQPYIECTKEEWKEWHSLRPYQASPCKIVDANDFKFRNSYGIMCGNTIRVRQIVTPPNGSAGPCVMQNCTPVCGGSKVCKYICPETFDFWLDAKDTRYPIAGSTEWIPESEGNPLPLPTSEWRLKNGKGSPDSFSNHLPPKIEESTEFSEYYKAIQRWRGNACVSINLFERAAQMIGINLPGFLDKDVMVCFDNIFEPNFWGTQFVNIPYSSTEDLTGIIESEKDIKFLPKDSTVEQVNPDPPNTMWDPKTPVYAPNKTNLWQADAFFPHMQENVDLINLMQSTYLPQELTKSSQMTNWTEIELPEIEKWCKIVETKENPGDRLFGQKIKAKVTYRAIGHTVCRWDARCNPLGCDPKHAEFKSDVDTYVPLLEELWTKTVAGQASLFRKVFPKIASGSAVEKIIDTPARSTVEHGAKGKIPGTVILLSDKISEVYFPHLGGIYQYMLEGVQTMIRPKGFPALPLNLAMTQPQSFSDRVNEYVSWFFNGTIYRSEQDPLSYNDPRDVSSVVNFPGPINKLLSQNSQWYNVINTWDIKTGNKEVKLGRADQIEKAKTNYISDPQARHNQVAGCTVTLAKIPIPFTGKTFILGGWPTACKDQSLVESIPSGGGASPPPLSAVCKPTYPDLPTDASCKVSFSTINGITLPNEMKKMFESAGAKWGVPPDLIAAAMFTEGGFEPRTQVSSCYGPYTEDSIKNAIQCEFPNCNPDSIPVPCNYSKDAGGCDSVGPYQFYCIFNNINRCNFYDATMLAAENLSRGRYGVASYPGGVTQCIGTNLNTGTITGSIGCQKTNWTCEDLVTSLVRWAGSCNPQATGSPAGHACLALKLYGACTGSCP